MPNHSSNARRHPIVTTAWPRTLGVVLALLVLVLLAPAAQAHSKPLNLRVVSYNVWGVPHIAPERSERVARIAEQLAALEPDVVALQEVWLAEDAERLGRPLAAAGLIHQRHFGPDGQHNKGAGLWFASRYPLERIDFVPYSAGQTAFIPWHVDYMANKGFALAQLRTPVGSVNVANTHMQSSYIFYHYRSTRLAQALQLAAGLAATAQEMPLIVAGDLNDTPESLPFRALSGRAGLLSASDHFALDAVLLRPGKQLQTRVAEVRELLTEPVVLSSGTSMALSDHPCVVVDVAIEGCDGCRAASLPPSTLRGELEGALSADLDETVKLVWLFRGSLVALFALGWILWRRRRPRSVMLRLALTALLLTTGGWCVYAVWQWAPYKLDMLAQQRRMLLAEAPAGAILSATGAQIGTR